MVTLSEVMAGLSAEQRAAVEARYQALANELRETDEALGDYTVNIIRSLPEAAAKLRAENDTLRARVAELEAAIAWACGEGPDEFGEEPPPLNGRWRRRYWWRSELRKRAGPERVTER